MIAPLTDAGVMVVRGMTGVASSVLEEWLLLQEAKVRVTRRVRETEPSLRVEIGMV
jgi:hypothetical protein